MIDFIVPNLTYKVTSSAANFPLPSMWKIAYGQRTMKTKEKCYSSPQSHHAFTFLLSWGRCTFDSYFLALPQHPMSTVYQLGTQSKQKQQQELAAIHYNRIKTFLGTSASPSCCPWRPRHSPLLPSQTPLLKAAPLQPEAPCNEKSQLFKQKLLGGRRSHLRTAGSNETGQQKGEKIN